MRKDKWVWVNCSEPAILYNVSGLLAVEVVFNSLIPGPRLLSTGEIMA